jgi:hypothetical protein
MTWKCGTGTQATALDPNGVTTSWGYDVLERVTSTREGGGADSRTSTVSFSDVNRTVTTTTPLDGRGI